MEFIRVSWVNIACSPAAMLGSDHLSADKIKSLPNTFRSVSILLGIFYFTLFTRAMQGVWRSRDLFLERPRVSIREINVSRVFRFLATFCFLMSQAVWPGDVNKCSAGQNLLLLSTSEIAEFNFNFVCVWDKKISISKSGSPKIITKNSCWNMYQTAETSLVLSWSSPLKMR